MPYPEKFLNESESKVLDLHPHWWFVGPPVFALAASVVVAVWASSLEGWLRSVVGFPVLALMILSAGWLLKRVVEWRFTYFVVTTERVIYQQGVAARRSKSITIDKINDIETDQSIFERVLGVGDVRIESGGEDGSSTFSDINRPIFVKNTINQLMQDKGDGPVRAAATDVVSQLERLEAMLERGTITQDEFDAQKRRLID